MPNYLNTNEVALVLKRTPATIRLWIKQKKIPATKIGKSYLISETVIQEILESKEKPWKLL